VAAATVRCATAGQRTLILSTDPAHSLSDSLQTELGSQPTDVADHVQAAEIDAQHELSRHWKGVQGLVRELLMQRGLDRIPAEELTVPPGVDELFASRIYCSAPGAGITAALLLECSTWVWRLPFVMCPTTFGTSSQHGLLAPASRCRSTCARCWSTQAHTHRLAT
jgi:arsenite/tail-anchored protein-transporting ATPase